MAFSQGQHATGVCCGEAAIIIKELKPTPYGLRYASASGRGSPLAFGHNPPGDNSMRKTCGKALLIVLSLVLALLIMEIAVRVVDLPLDP